MTIKNDNGATSKIPNLTSEQKQRIYDFLQGAVYCWCKNRKDEWFHYRDLVSGNNRNWHSTPLMEIYQHRVTKKSSAPKKSAGKDVGWFLKEVLRNDKHKFESQDGNRAKKYRWIG